MGFRGLARPETSEFVVGGLEQIEPVRQFTQRTGLVARTLLNPADEVLGYRDLIGDVSAVGPAHFGRSARHGDKVRVEIGELDLQPFDHVGDVVAAGNEFKAPTGG